MPTRPKAKAMAEGSVPKASGPEGRPQEGREEPRVDPQGLQYVGIAALLGRMGQSLQEEYRQQENASMELSMQWQALAQQGEIQEAAMVHEQTMFSLYRSELEQRNQLLGQAHQELIQRARQTEAERGTLYVECHQKLREAESQMSEQAEVWLSKHKEEIGSSLALHDQEFREQLKHAQDKADSLSRENSESR